MEELKEVKSENPTKKQTVKYYGKICNCRLLNIRKEASLKSPVLGVLDNKSNFTINKSQSTDEFYKISYNGMTGYCLKDFVEVSTNKGE